MIKNQTRLYLKSSSLSINTIIDYNDFVIIKTNNNEEYLCRFVTNSEYQTYFNLLKYSDKIKKTIYEQKNNDGYLLFFDYEKLTEEKVKSKRIVEILRTIFQKSSFEITLKKTYLNNINNIYKVLDNKFIYLEMRIREIETAYKKDDISWIILSKYNIILDAKIFLYDLQQDIFKAIDNSIIVNYGLIYKNIDFNLYNNKKILPSFDLYYGPIGMLYCRLYLQLDEEDIYDDILKLDNFDQKYFCFMCLYILILNINLEIILNNYSIANYLLVTKKIKSFILKYQNIMKK